MAVTCDEVDALGIKFSNQPNIPILLSSVFGVELYRIYGFTVYSVSRKKKIIGKSFSFLVR